MIRLGVNTVSLYPNSGIIFQNRGNIVFKGHCAIGNNSAISVGKTGHVEFGENFAATASLRLTSYHSLVFGEGVSIGWDCLFMDTDFHKMTKLAGGYSKGYGDIRIGKNNWIAARTTVLKNAHTPDYCTVAAGSVLSKAYDFPEYSVIGLSSEMKVVKHGVFRNYGDDRIEFSCRMSNDKEN